jgi:N-acetylglucosamine-6-phosphate deacetylase
MPPIAITARKLFTPLEEIDDAVLVVEDHVIRAVGSRSEVSVPSHAKIFDAGDRIIAPGYVEIHVHGAAGHDVMEATPQAFSSIARALARHGTTSFLPTTVTASKKALLNALTGIGTLIHSWKTLHENTKEALAEPLGIHMEGPFISSERRGVHPENNLQTPSVKLFQEFLDSSRESVRILTIAPELNGAAELQSYAIGRGIKVAIGHSDATYAIARMAIDSGASHAVHTFNAMRPFNHRETGIIGAVLTDDRILAEVIADGVHVSEPALRLLLRAKGSAGIILVTDGISATGQGPGKFQLGEMEVFVAAEPNTRCLVCRSGEGILAGSVLTQDIAVQNMVATSGATLRDAVRMATWNPAKLLGIEAQKGCLRPGADADAVLLNLDGSLAGTMTRGATNFI